MTKKQRRYKNITCNPSEVAGYLHQAEDEGYEFICATGFQTRQGLPKQMLYFKRMPAIKRLPPIATFEAEGHS